MTALPFPPNELRYRPGDKRGHVESFFIKANSPGGNRAIWIKHTVLVPDGRPEDAVAEVWAVAFVRGDRSFPIAAKETVPLSRARFRSQPFRAEHPAATMDSSRARGAVEANEHSLGWSIEMEGKGPGHVPFPLSRMYTAPFPRTKVLTPAPDTQLFGSFEVDGQRWAIDGWRGAQGHNWGPAHSSPYAWAHCNAWESDEDGFLEAMAAQMTVGGVRTPWLTNVALRIKGETLRFDGPRTLVSDETVTGFDHFRFRALRKDAELTGVIRAQRSDMAGLRYENPDGTAVTCLNSKLADVRLLLRRPAHPDLELRSRRGALEIGTTALDHGVRILA
jgi:hypothetical protein